MSDARRVAVIGAGWAGCAAATELVRRRIGVTVYEAARTPGGRARTIQVDGMMLDNGQHMLLGAYRQTLCLMRTVGVDPRQNLLRLPLQICYPASGDGIEFIAAHLPTPFHLLVGLWSSRGLAHADKLALARFMTSARWMGWRLNQDCSALELVQRFDQTERITQLLWQPLCVAALNTPLERASAQVFLAVLHDSLGARRAASDMLVPRTGLSTLFPQPALAFVIRHGGQVRLGSGVKSLARSGTRWLVDSGSTAEHFDAVIVATAPRAATNLLKGLATIEAIAAFTYEPIATCYLQYAPTLRLARPWLALQQDATTNRHGQFVFDRGQFDASQAGLLAVVISAAGDAIMQGHEGLAAACAQQLAVALNLPALAKPRWNRIITEKHAGFSCCPNLPRPANHTSAPGLLLAGDYTAGPYPATLEGAVRSGLAAARLI